MNGKTALCNLALGHIGVGAGLTEVDAERSMEARACRQFYDIVREIVLRDFPWPFATRIAALALVEENPNDEYSYAYRYPADCLNARRILSGVRNDTMQTRVVSKIGRDDEGQLIYTDRESAELEYTGNEEESATYPPDVRMALSLLLAHYIAPMLTKGDQLKLGDKALQRYTLIMGRARSIAANEETPDLQPESELIGGRE